MTVKSEIHRRSTSAAAEDHQELEQDWLLLWSSSDAIAEEDTAEISGSMLFNTESPSSAFWTGEFIPPPPRPPYLEDQISADGLTTCDLCTWALEKYSEPDSNFISLNFGLSNHLFVILIVVSILSACLGAIIMIVLIQCKSRINSTDPYASFFYLGRRKARTGSRNDANIEIDMQNDGKNVDDNSKEIGRSLKPSSSWNLLNRPKRPIPMQLSSITSATNHYTVEEAYASINDAVYTELDRISSADRRSYQNSGYVIESDNDPTISSSAPSSAYYSDISAQDGRGYEAVGGVQQASGHWDIPINERPRRKLSNRKLSAIGENIVLHSSDYI